MFCKNCGNKLDDNDKVCSVCGERVESPYLSGGDESELGKNSSITDNQTERKMDKQDENAQLSVGEDIKTPLFNFKWNVQDFPKEEASRTEDIDFRWSKTKTSSESDSSVHTPSLEKHEPIDKPVVEQMKNAVDPEVIERATPFSDEVMKEKPITDDWYEPFSIKESDDADTIFKFNKRNEEFQELLDREYEKYNKVRKESTVDVNTRKYTADFIDAVEAEAQAKAQMSGIDEVIENKAPQVQAAEEPEISKVQVIEAAEETKVPEAKMPEEIDEVQTAEDVENEASQIQAAEEPKIAKVQVAKTAEETKVPEPKTSGDVAGMNLFAGNLVSPIAAGETKKAESKPAAPELQKVGQSQQKVEHADSDNTGKNKGVTSFIDTSFASPFGDSSQIATKQINEKPGDGKSIDNDDFLRDLPSESEDSTDDDNQKSGYIPSPFEASGKPVGPEIVDEPVVFPFEMEDKTGPQPVVSDQGNTQEKAEQKPENDTKTESVSQPNDLKTEQNPPTASHESSKKEGTGLIKALVAIIIVILLLLGSIGVMKLAPNTGLGIILNNLFSTVLSIGSAESEDAVQTVAPSADLNKVITSQLSANHNIKQIVYDDSVGYDESISYKMSGANNSKAIENNFWRSSDNGDLLFDEQVVATIIGYNSAWVGYVNNDYKDVFDFVYPGSAAEKSLKEEEIGSNTSVEFSRLGIGEIRQNGNKFYVWTSENIVIDDGKDNKDKVELKQLYELEAIDDSLKITTVVKLKSY